jgi:hypothetical protein
MLRSEAFLVVNISVKLGGRRLVPSLRIQNVWPNELHVSGVALFCHVVSSRQMFRRLRHSL